jgi:DnaK suppressor protein
MRTPSNTSPGTSAAGQARHRVLQAMLCDRQRELQNVLRLWVRQPPAGGPDRRAEDAEQAAAYVQEDIEVALIQMKGETLQQVRDALVRLEAGDYGNCADCGGEIAERRLRALPFAVRCTVCEEAREQVLANERRSAGRQRFSTAWADQTAS